MTTLPSTKRELAAWLNELCANAKGNHDVGKDVALMRLLTVASEILERVTDDDDASLVSLGDRLTKLRLIFASDRIKDAWSNEQQRKRASLRRSPVTVVVTELLRSGYATAEIRDLLENQTTFHDAIRVTDEVDHYLFQPRKGKCAELKKTSLGPTVSRLKKDLN